MDCQTRLKTTMNFHLEESSKIGYRKVGSKRMENTYNMDTKFPSPQSHTCTSLLDSYTNIKGDLNAKNIFHLEEQHFMTIKLSTQKDTMILNLYEPNPTQKTHEEKLTKFKGERQISSNLVSIEIKVI